MGLHAYTDTDERAAHPRWGLCRVCGQPMAVDGCDLCDYGLDSFSPFSEGEGVS